MARDFLVSAIAGAIGLVIGTCLTNREPVPCYPPSPAAVTTTTTFPPSPPADPPTTVS